MAASSMEVKSRPDGRALLVMPTRAECLDDPPDLLAATDAWRARAVRGGYARCCLSQPETTSSTAAATAFCGAGSRPGSSARAWPISGM